MIIIRGSVWRPAVFAIGCMVWILVGCKASESAASKYHFRWSDDLAQSPSLPLAGLDCRNEDGQASVRVAARLANKTGVSLTYRIVFDLAASGETGEPSRVCDQALRIEPGETRAATCTIGLPDGNVVHEVRVAAWNGQVYPICDRGCPSSQGKCLIVPALWTRLSWPDVRIAIGVTVVAGFLLVGLGASGWRLAGLWGRIVMGAFFGLSLLAACVSIEGAIRDSLGYAIVIVPEALAVVVAARWLRRHRAADGS